MASEQVKVVVAAMRRRCTNLNATERHQHNDQ